jgi:thiol-disulfide isomerase/thioredoxin
MPYLLALVALLVVPLHTLAQERQQPLTPSPLSTLIFRDTQGQEHSLSSLHSKIVVLNFWATWCVPCREEMPLLMSLQKRYGGHGVQVIGASVDDESTQAEIASFSQKLKINFPIWIGATLEQMQGLGLGNALPATVVLDRDGQIVGRIIGMVAKGDLQRRIDWLLSNRTTPAPPPFLNTIEEHAHDRPQEHGHKHEGEEEHEHASVAIEGVSSVPS